jgi:hypothetical protein
MSTQRREDRGAPTTKIRWQERRSRLRLAICADRAGSLGNEFPTSPARSFPASVARRTAPPVDTVPYPNPQEAQQQSWVAGFPGMAATNSLRSDHPTQQHAWPVQLNIRFGSPPLRQAAARRPLCSLPSGVPPIHFPAVSARLHPTLPRVPAAKRCWTERYDGKRDLHFKHAA